MGAKLLSYFQLPTPVLTKRLSLIFLWAEFSWRAPIPIVKPLLKMVCGFGGLWGAHSYSASQKYNKIPNNFWDQLSLLVINCWQCDDKLNFGLKKRLMNEVLLWLLMVIDMCYLLPIEQWIKKLSSFLLPKLIILILSVPMIV